MKWGTMESLLSAIRSLVPELTSGKHKGQAGRIAVVGGCREYTGAPYFAAISALRLGADLSHVFCSRDAASVIKSYSPELIVHPLLRESHEESGEPHLSTVDSVISSVSDWLPRFHCLVIGPGLGRDPLMMDSVSGIISAARAHSIPMVIDADALFLITSRPELIHGCPSTILTPNVNEFSRLAAKMGLKQDEGEGMEEVEERLKLLSQRLGHVTIVQKGHTDLISDGTSVLECGLFGSPRRCGGQGDVLCGSIALFMAWAKQRERALQAASLESNSEGRSPGGEPLGADGSSTSHSSRPGDENHGGLPADYPGGSGSDPGLSPSLLAGFAGSLVVRHAASSAFERKKRSMVTGDVIEELGQTLEALFPVGPWHPQGLPKALS